MNRQETHDQAEENTPVLNGDVFAGKWKQLRGTIQQKWGELTNDDLDQVAGSARKMMGVLQERYGYTKERAQQELDQLVNPRQLSK